MAEGEAQGNDQVNECTGGRAGIEEVQRETRRRVLSARYDRRESLKQSKQQARRPNECSVFLITREEREKGKPKGRNDHDGQAGAGQACHEAAAMLQRNEERTCRDAAGLVNYKAWLQSLGGASS